MNIDLSPKQLNYVLISLRRHLKELTDRDDEEMGDDYHDIMAIEDIIEQLENIQKQNISAV
ncbi:MAG: hypothetical protein OEZ68_18120 [Gammaproteobacteria bacterium]|nr:hypothetical protein [Gammaproteobacteria bacterium]MDH5802722.1 hypothetical protein [Gammaproteobacteria bacterium]